MWQRGGVTRLLLPLLLLASCAHAPPPREVESTPPSPPPPWYGDLPALAKEAAAVRGLELTLAFEVVPLDDDAFFAEHGRLAREGSGALLRELEETLREFSGGAFEPLVGNALRSSVDEVRREQVVAFYAFASHRLYVRRVVPPVLDAAGAHARFLGMAHEVGHVLQDQQGLGARVPTSFEAAAAWRAVLEGDATLTATLLDAKRKGLSPTRAVERARLAFRAMNPQQLVELSGLSTKLLEAPAVVRELFLFPYFFGHRFVLDLHHAGGLALVRRALETPPTRTDALYAPQRWLDGAPRLEPIGEPPRRLGLLLTRALLLGCERRVPRAGVFGRWLEAHYVDDSFRRAGRTLSWATSWDVSPAAIDRVLRRESGGGEEADADDLESVNRAMRTMTPAMVLACIGVDRAEVTEATSGDVVGQVAWAPGADRSRLANLVARTPVEREPPVAAAHIEEPRLDAALRAVGPGVLTGASWTHEKLGLALELEEGRVAENPAANLMAVGPGAVLLVTFIDEPPTARSDDAFVNVVLDGFMKSARIHGEGLPLSTRHPWTERKRGDVVAHETQGEFDGPLSAHAVVVPLCGGQAAVYVVGLGLHASGQALIERWLASLRATGEPPVCAAP